jgi:hypothetical protein
VLRDVQRIFNYAISTQTEIIALQPKAPFIGTRAQFEKYVDQWETANTKNWPYLEYTHVAGVPAPQRSQPAVASTGLDDLMLATQNAMHSTTGIYPAALGGKSNETSGKAIMARQREGDTGTYVYLDNFGRAMRRTGQIIVNSAGEIYDTKRVIQIVGEDGKLDKLEVNKPQLGPNGMTHLMLNDVTIGAYEVSVEMGPSFSTKREEAREGMTELLRTLGPEAAMMFMDLYVRAMDWPLADKIAKRAEQALPKNIRENEAKEAGKEPPEPPKPPPPTPEMMQAMEEQKQANIELARKNELESRRQEIELEKIELERERIRIDKLKLAQGELQAMRDHETGEREHELAAGEHEIRRGEQDIAASQQDLDKRGQDVEAIGMAASEINGEREHELALNPPAEGAPAPAKGKAKAKPAAAAGTDAQQTEDIDDLKGHVAALTNTVMELRQIVSQMTSAEQPDIAPQDGLQLDGAPPMQPPPPETIDPGAAALMGQPLPQI